MGTSVSPEPAPPARHAPTVVPCPAGPRQKLLDRVRDAIRTRHYSRRTEQAYVDWIRRYIAFHRMTHPAQLGASDVSQFLTWLAVDRRVSASTQNQALSALLFLYTHVLAIEIPAMPPVVRARTPERLPVVLSREEVDAILAHLEGVAHLFVMLLYGSGLRLEECLTLRVKDVDFDRHQILVRGHHQARGPAHDAPLVRDESARSGVRHSHGAGTARALGRQDDDDVSPRHESWRAGREESDGSTVSGYARASRVSTGGPDRAACSETLGDEPFRVATSSSLIPGYAPAAARIRVDLRFGGRYWRGPSRVSTPAGDQTPARIAPDSQGDCERGDRISTSGDTRRLAVYL